MTVNERVSRGAEFLDSIDSEWAFKVNLGLVDLSSCTKCILGQVFGDYVEACLHYKIPGYDYGFHPGRCGNPETLRKLWIEEITRRRS